MGPLGYGSARLMPTPEYHAAFEKATAKTVIKLRHGQRGWTWRAVAANGEPIATSEPYVSKSSAVRGAARSFPEATVVVDD